MKSFHVVSLMVILGCSQKERITTTSPSADSQNSLELTATGNASLYLFLNPGILSGSFAKLTLDVTCGSTSRSPSFLISSLTEKFLLMSKIPSGTCTLKFGLVDSSGVKTESETATFDAVAGKVSARSLGLRSGRPTITYYFQDIGRHSVGSVNNIPAYLGTVRNNFFPETGFDIDSMMEHVKAGTDVVFNDFMGMRSGRDLVQMREFYTPSSGENGVDLFTRRVAETSRLINERLKTIAPENRGRVVMQVGNEISSGVFSCTVRNWSDKCWKVPEGATKDDGATGDCGPVTPDQCKVTEGEEMSGTCMCLFPKTKWSDLDYGIIPTYAEDYLAPLVATLLKEGGGTTPALQVMLGSAPNAFSSGKRDWLYKLLDYVITGTAVDGRGNVVARDLVGKKVRDIIDYASYHYMVTGQSEDSDTVLSELLAQRFGDHLKGFWATEELGGHRMDAGVAPREGVRVWAQYIHHWLTNRISDDENRLIYYVASGKNNPASLGLNYLYSFIQGTETPSARDMKLFDLSQEGALITRTDAGEASIGQFYLLQLQQTGRRLGIWIPPREFVGRVEGFALKRLGWFYAPKMTLVNLGSPGFAQAEFQGIQTLLRDVALTKDALGRFKINLPTPLSLNNNSGKTSDASPVFIFQMTSEN